MERYSDLQTLSRPQQLGIFHLFGAFQRIPNA
jgi:hypothetical protein